MFSLADPPAHFAENPFPVYDQLIRSEPVCPQPDGSVILFRHADLAQVYRDTATFLSDKKALFAPKFGAGSPLYRHHTTSLVFNDPPLHGRVRRIMASALTPRAITRMVPGLERTIDGLLDQLPAQADLIRDFSAGIPIEVIGNLLDIPAADRGPLRDWSLAILGALEPRVDEAALARGNTAVVEFSDYLRSLVAVRRRNPGDPETDVLTRLIAGERDELLDENELIQNCIFLLNAGHETTTNLIGNALVLFCDDRQSRADLLADPGLADRAIEEVLRVRSPNQFGNRQAARDITIGGYDIAAGTNIHLCIGAANRDPDVFSDPGRFDITRHPNRHLAFAAGPHVCIGLTLARMEARLATLAFMQRFPRYRIVDRRPGGRIRFHGYSALCADLGNTA